jgi:hypothetical protein
MVTHVQGQSKLWPELGLSTDNGTKHCLLHVYIMIWVYIYIYIYTLHCCSHLLRTWSHKARSKLARPGVVTQQCISYNMGMLHLAQHGDPFSEVVVQDRQP